MAGTRTVRPLASPDSGGDPAVDRARARRVARNAAPRLERNLLYTGYALSDLRSAQTVLREETSRVEYWRRILRAKTGAGRHRLGADHDQMTQVLRDARNSPQRFAFIAGGDVGLVELPDLAELWTRPADPSDETAAQRRTLDLEEADKSLGAYLAHLHAVVRLLTNEVIVRYREDPALALLMLPPIDERRAHAYG